MSHSLSESVSDKFSSSSSGADMEGSGTFVGGPSPVSELMGVVPEGSEYWSPKGDNVICSYLGEGEVGRERKRVHVCVGVHVYVWYSCTHWDSIVNTRFEKRIICTIYLQT